MSESALPASNPAPNPPARSHLRGFLINTAVILGLGGLLACLLLPATRSARPAARRTQCKNNLKQIGLALHNYAQDYGVLPPACTVDRYGHRLHSWRTLLLPYLDQRPLYEMIDLSKPWDDPANARALNEMPAVFRCPEFDGEKNHTTYLANVATGGVFRIGEPRAISEITDGTSNTLMVVEVPHGKAVPWMSPNDADETLALGISPKSKLGHDGIWQAAFCDGTVRPLGGSIPFETRRALLSIAGGEEPGEF